jgi:monovalent cation:H+ antiporter-2, CPA2 family
VPFNPSTAPLLVGVTLPFLGEIVALFVMSVLIAYVCFRLKLVPIVGFLLAGTLVGPYALGLVDDVELITSTAEIGVILLLFTIGAEFSIEKLSRIGRAIMVGGGLQVSLSIVATVIILLAFGVDWRAAAFTGGLVALSSTAIVLSLLSDRAESESPTGQLSLAVLIFQDLAVVAMVLFLPLLGGEGVSTWALLRSLGTALLLITAVLFLARRLVPWLLEKIAETRRQELFLLSVVAVCFGTAFVTSLAGVSLALGAFLAGIVVSESRYSDQALSEILPLRTIFNAIFFVSIGMLLDLEFLITHLPLVLGIAAGVLLLKAILTAGSVMALGYPVRTAATVGLTLAQIGEFSFVLERAGAALELYPAGLSGTGGQTLIAVTVLLMIVTPFLVSAAPRLGSILERTPLSRIGKRTKQERAEAAVPFEDHVIVIGYGPAGQRLVQVLRNTGIPFVILELNPRLAARAEEESLPVIRGDASRPHMLEMAGIEHAKLCVVAINDRAATTRAVQMVHYLNPTVQLIVRARFLSDVEPLQQAGADIVVPEELETAIRLFTQVLGAYLIPPDEINQHVNAIRSGDYRVFRGSIHEAHLMVLQGLDEEGLHTRAVAVRKGASVEGKTLAELSLRQEHGISVLAVRREGRTIGNPAGDFRVLPGDRLVMVGTADRFAATAGLFRESKPDFQGNGA